MHVLVTGGAGFIGSHFVRHALGRPEVRVTNLDALTYAGVPASLADVEGDERYRFVHGDVRDAALVVELVAQADAVVHFAAESHVDRSIESPTGVLDTNVVGSGVVFEACRAAGTPRVLFASTDEVYGSVDAPHRAAEQAPLRPSSPYAASKAAADLLARSYAVTYGYPITVTRAANTFGPNQLPEKAVPLFLTRLLEGGTVPLYGDGGHVRDWLYVADNVAAQWAALTRGTPGEVYNVGAGNDRTNRQLAVALLACLGVPADDHAERIVHVEDRPGHDRRYAVDDGKLRSLGWSPTISFDDGLAATVDWYRSSVDWWRPLVRDGVATRRGRSS